MGRYALWKNETGNQNTAYGDYAMKQFRADGGTYNTAIGRSSQRGPNSDGSYYTGSYNTSVGSGSLKVITTGSNNTQLWDTILSMETQLLVKRTVRWDPIH